MFTPAIFKRIFNHTIEDHEPYKRFVPCYNTEDFLDFQSKFASEDDCISFFYHVKWPRGFHCPQCSFNEAYVIKSRRLPLYECRSCHHQTSLTANTIMENSRTPLRKWLTAIYLTSQTDYGTNARQLQKIIQVTYKTAWSMFSLIRNAISEADAGQPLSGTVRGSFGICSKVPFKAALTLHPQEKPVHIAASLDENEQPLHFKMKLISSEHTKNNSVLPSSINSFRLEHVDFAAKDIIFIPRFRFHKLRPIKNLYDNVNRWLTYTYSGLQRKHLQSYLDEACYRINLTLHGKPIFENLSKLCMTTLPKNKRGPRITKVNNYFTAQQKATEQRRKWEEEWQFKWKLEREFERGIPQTS